MDESSVISREAAEQQLRRVTNSREFTKAPQMRRFLLFIGESALAGRESELKEYTIAVAVFNRSSDFNQRADPVVRNEARRLRKKLDLYYATEGVNDPLRIQLPIGGYVPNFETQAPTEQVPEPEAAVQSETELPLKPQIAVAAKSFRMLRYAAAGAVSFLLITTAVALWIFKNYSSFGDHRIHSIAVLPFESLSSDRDIDLLAEGIADEVLNSLTRVPKLKVVAPMSALRVNTLNLGARETAQKLGVETLLEGSVRLSQGTLRIIPRLVDARDGHQLWSQSYEFQTKSLFGIQDSIARAVTQSLGYSTQNTPQQQTNPGDGEGYRAYILGKQYLTEFEEGTAPANKPITTLRRAVALDAGNAEAWATLAVAYGTAVERGAIAATEGNREAIRYGDKALVIDPNSPVALAVKGSRIAALNHDWEGSDRLFRRAIALKPSDAWISSVYVYCLLWPTGRFEDAQRELEKAVDLDPMNATYRSLLSDTLYFRHQYASAIRVAEGALALSPSSQTVACSLLRPLLFLKRADKLAELIKRYWETGPQRPYMKVFELYAANNIPAAQQLARATLGDHHCPPCEPFLYSVLNDEAGMIRTFENVPIPNFWAIACAHDPIYDRYRSKPTFQTMMKKMLSPQ